MLELEHGFQALDVHARLDPDRQDPHGRAISPEGLEREMRQAGIVRAVVSPGPRADDYLRANNAVARHTVDRPFVPFARINGPRDPSGTPAARLRNLAATRDSRHVSPEDVEQYGYGDRFRGFKLAPARDGLPDPEVLDTLEAVDLPVIVKVTSEFPPAAVEETLLRRDLVVVLAHFGGFPLNRGRMREAIDLLPEYEDCYLDTSVVRYRDVLERTMREHPDRVLFGSGAPDIHPDVGVMEILTLDVPEDAMRKAFEKNPSRAIPALEVPTPLE